MAREVERESTFERLDGHIDAKMFAKRRREARDERRGHLGLRARHARQAVELKHSLLVILKGTNPIDKDEARNFIDVFEVLQCEPPM